MAVASDDLTAPEEPDVEEIIQIHDPGIDVEAIMDRVRENLARRRAEGAYQEDLDALRRDAWGDAPQPVTGGPPAGHGLATVISELNVRWTIRESAFVSHVPLVGPVIAGIRTAWNSVSTKWYVRPMMHQQVEFNGLAVQALNALNAERRAAEARCARQEEEIRRLAAEIGLLRARLDALTEAEPASK